MNSMHIIGNLGMDPERRSFTDADGNERSIAVFSVAVNRPRRRDGSQQTDWFNVKVFGAQADPCLQHLSKGRQVGVTGRMESSRPEGHEGPPYWDLVATQVDFIGPRPEGTENGNGGAQAAPAAAAPAAASGGSGSKLPF
jgi:single-strand DNA-binding protein